MAKRSQNRNNQPLKDIKVSKRVIHLDLFSGIGGFHLGMKEAGIEFTDHYFSEVDKHAIANYKYNFKNSIYIGSVTAIRDIIRTINKQPGDRLFITFGSPCQDFSLAGKRAGIEGSKSSLIKFAIFLIRWLRPDVYIWENVKGAFSTNNGADFWGIIQAFTNIGGYGLEWQLVNSTWVVPQNRERIYLVGHLADRSKPGIFPFTEVDTRINEGAIETANVRTLNAGGNSGGLHSAMTLIKSNTSQGFEIAEPGDSINFSNPNSKTRRGRVGKGVAQTLDTQANQGVIQINPNLESGGKQPYQQNRVYSDEGIIPALNAGKSDLLIAAQRGRGGIKDTKQQLEIRTDGNTNTLTGVQKDNLVFENSNVKSIQRIIDKHEFIEGEPKALDLYNNSIGDVSPTLTGPKHNNNGLFDGTNIRRLTEIECERLQTFPDNHTEFGIYETKNGLETKKIPRSQRYKLLGNAVTKDIVKLISQRIELI